MKIPRFKDEYVLVTGYPWAFGIGPNYHQVGMSKGVLGISFNSFSFPSELWSKSVPRYELVLRKVKK